MPPFDDPRWYDRVAAAYALAQRLLPMWPGYARRALPWLGNARAVLEIGCGPGALLGSLAQPGRIVIGLDRSKSMLSHAGRRRPRGEAAECLVQADALALPLATASVDAVVLAFALSAITRGDAALTEIARVLRPGGVLAIVDAALPADQRLGRAISRLWAAWGTHIHDQATLVRSAGLQVETQIEFGAFQSIRLTIARRA